MVTLKRIAPPRPKGNTTGRIIGGIGPEGSHKPGVPAENLGPAAQERNDILDMLEKVPKPDQKLLALLAGVLAKDAAWAKGREIRTQKLAQTAQKAGLAMPSSAEKAANDVKAIENNQKRLGGSLTIQVLEKTSGQPIPGVQVDLNGPSSQKGTTDPSGSLYFASLPEGDYMISLYQEGMDMQPFACSATVRQGAHTHSKNTVVRIINGVVIKRIEPRGRLKALANDKSELEYGHWWLEIDGKESYGWWPSRPVGPVDTVVGVPGSLNRMGNAFRGSSTQDAHHGDSAEIQFKPSVQNGLPPDVIKANIRAFAKAYSGKWSWPTGQNCHSFQEDLMKKCDLSQSSSVTVP